MKYLKETFVILFVLCISCQYGKCEEPVICTKYFQFEYAGEKQVYCVDYKLDTLRGFGRMELIDFEPVENSIDFPKDIISWFVNFIRLEMDIQNSQYEFHDSEIIDLTKGETVRILDFNVDGTKDIGFLNREASGKNVIYDVYLNINNNWVRWYGAPNPIWGVNVEERTITGGWSMSRNEITSGTEKVVGDTSLQLIHLWKTWWDKGNDKLIRKDSIFENNTWKIEIDSNFTFDN